MSKEKIFVISRQKCGTTSTGEFLRDHGIKCLSPDGRTNRLWSIFVQNNQFEKVFQHPLISEYQAFEDNPWWMRGMPQKLLSQFPEAKFILVKRDKNSWFDSLKSHFNEYGGFTCIHAHEYDRTSDYFEYLYQNRGLMRNEHAFQITEDHREHYCEIYESRHDEILGVFAESGKEQQLFTSNLEEPNLWVEMGKFLNLEVDKNYTAHQNKKEQRRIRREKSFIKDLKWLLLDHLK